MTGRSFYVAYGLGLGVLLVQIWRLQRLHRQFVGWMAGVEREAARQCQQVERAHHSLVAYERARAQAYVDRCQEWARDPHDPRWRDGQIFRDIEARYGRTH